MLLSIDNADFLAGFTTREGGVSEGEYKSLNLAFHTGDGVSKIEQNRSILQEHIGAKKLIFMDQQHGKIVREIADLKSEPAACDAVWTRLKGVALCVMVADCTPILVFDKKEKIIAAIHAGRAGVTHNILTKTIAKMGSYPQNLSVIIGPNISGECYEIGDLDLGWFNRFKTKDRFDMNAALLYEIETMGIRDYDFSGVCSHCDERFYSYRRDGVTGRFCGFIMLKGQNV